MSVRFTTWDETRFSPQLDPLSFDQEKLLSSDSFYVPLAFLFLSALWQFTSLIYRRCGSSRSSSNEEASGATIGRTQNLKGHANSFGGYTIFGFMIAIVICNLVLLYLTLLAPPIVYCQPIYTTRICLQPVVIIFSYTFLLSVVSLVSKQWSERTTTHVNIISLATLILYLYRDVWPLATYYLEPEDSAEGTALWVKIAVLTISAVVIPLSVPKAYVPVDPENPMDLPGRELVDPWISRLLFTFIDPVIILANKVSHLRADQLPALLDVDRASYISKQTFPHIDPLITGKRKHILWGLLWYFRWEFFIIGLALAAASLLTFAAPISIIKILGYIETHGENATVKPWLWVLLFFVGQVGRSVVRHWELYIETIMLVKAQAFLTQLAFEHSLRIRLKAETAKSVHTSEPQTPSSEGEAGDETSTVAGEDVVLDSTGQDEADSQSSSTVGASSSETGTSSTTSAVKGKAKVTTTQPKAPPKGNAQKPSSSTENTLGKINNLVTSDLGSIVEGTELLTFLLYVPMQIVISVVFLFKVLGWSSFIGLAITSGMGPIAGFIAKKMQSIYTTKMKMTDARVQTITEAISILRMVKLFGWESKMKQKIEKKREDELLWIWRSNILNVATSAVSNIVPTLAMFATYATYTVIMKEQLSASKIFSSIAVFNILRNQISQISWQANTLVQTKVSLDRFNTFLLDTELLDQFSADQNNVTKIAVVDEENQEDIGFRNAVFMWSTQTEDGSLTPGSRHFKLRIEGTILFKPGCINMIVGPTGSGKTSLLMALLGEMHFIPSQIDAWFNLPRGGNVAYAAQEPWVLSATIKENILFGSVYEEEKYKNVIYQCALEQDLALFDAGDDTEVGERGLTLSGGQKARISLARAIYSNARIILLDDVFAALDVHTSVWVVNKCLRGDLVAGRTLIVVTHNITLVGPIAKQVISVTPNGAVILEARSLDIVSRAENNVDLASEIKNEEKATENETGTPIKKQDHGKLVLTEEIAEGHVTWKSFELLISGLGGNHPTLFIIFLIASTAIITVIFTAQTWFLGVWGDQYDRNASEVNLYFYLTWFATLIIVHTVLSSSFTLFFCYRTIHCSRTIHAKLMHSVFGSTFRWLDETPTGRIITRCTQDIRAVDSSVPSHLLFVTFTVMSSLISLGAIVIFTPVFMLPGFIVGVLGALLGNWYLRAQLSIKREMSNARAPVLSHFNTSIHGLVSIRAYGAQQAFREESFRRIDHYTRMARTSWNVNRWIGLRMDFLGAVFVSLLAFYQLYVETYNASTTGFSLNMALGFCGTIFYLIRLYNTFEVQSNSLERINGYLDIDHEPASSQGGKPPASWPTSGDLRVENLSARYSQSSPTVLHDLSFHVKSGERIGVVGRTGSGKSSLTLALLRCIILEGDIYYDGIPIKSVNIDSLRSNITIIPQSPELLSGTLRQNLDPFEQNDDAVLNDALRAAGLFSLQEEANEAYLTLDSNIAGSGNNLSVGQKQIIALARAMVRSTKLLILDEATSAIDYKTDTIIQQSLRTQLPPDTTVITIAHRLQTIMDADKIMVLDKGHIVEFDTPQALLSKESGAFKTLVDENEDKHDI